MKSYYHNNHLGTPQKMTDNSGTVVWAADYKPFGETTITVSTITNNLRFPGQYFDAETDLYYNYFRDYNPVIGRYIEADPIGIKEGQNHLYTYVGNNPEGTVDIWGLDFTNKGNNVIWVLKDGMWRPVSPGATEYGETDAAVSVPEKCSKKCKAYKWVDCYDAMGQSDSSGGMVVKLVFSGEKHLDNKSIGRKAACSNPLTASLAQAAKGGWVDPIKEFGSAPTGCEN